MNIGKAAAIFKNINLNDWTAEEKKLAIKTVLGMETYNGVTKQEFRNALEWMMNNSAAYDVEKVVKGGWIPCSEKMPENEKEVEITYTREHYITGEVLYFTARAFYEDGTLNTEDSKHCWYDIDNWERDEEADAYIVPEGWWEYPSFAEEFGIVDMPVIAWRPLPLPYKPERIQKGN